MSGVEQASVCRLMSAPALTNNRTMSTCPWAAAVMSAVWRCSVASASISRCIIGFTSSEVELRAPKYDRIASAHRMLPSRAATCSTVPETQIHKLDCQALRKAKSVRGSHCTWHVAVFIAITSVSTNRGLAIGYYNMVLSRNGKVSEKTVLKLTLKLNRVLPLEKRPL